MNTDAALLTLAEAVAAVRKREISARALTEACLARIERLQPVLNCFIRIDADRALAAADAADQATARGEALGPLHGVPLAHKDMFYRAGTVATCGSKIRSDFVPGHTATVLERLDAAGAISLGMLNMAEFAVGPTGHNTHWGDCRNAWNPAHIAGGSSSGSGAATAARLCFGALGSDTGGSIRTPAAVNGLFGLKPTTGRVSRHGAMGLSFTLDTVGPLARTAEDCALLFSIIAGADPKDPTSAQSKPVTLPPRLDGDIAGLRIGVPRRPPALDPEIEAKRVESLAVLEGLGARLVELDVPEDGILADLGNLVMGVEAATLHLQWLRERPEDYQPQVLGRLLPGLSYPGVAYLEALQARPHYLTQFTTAVLDQCDALHWPVLPMKVPTRAATDIGAGDGMQDMIRRLSAFTRPLNYLGLPGLAMPVGFDEDGMPVSFQLIGRPFDELTLLRIGHAVDQATGISRRTPPV
ncbi:MAG TPA: amidase [Aliidongia sp.]|nr:amidase [Aliidongia sp.]